MFTQDEKPNTPTGDTSIDDASSESKGKLDDFIGFFKKTKRKPSAVSQETQQGNTAEPVSEELFEPEAWKPLVKTPFLLLQVGTGSKRFELDNDEAKILAVQGSQTAKYFLNTHPKWIALTLFSLNLSGLLAFKTMAYMNDRKEEYLKKNKDRLSAV